MPTIAGGKRRLLFTGNVKTNLVNKYTSGAGVGAISTSSRRALKRRATSSAGTLDSKGNLIPGKPCCSIELERKPKAIDHLMLGVSLFSFPCDCSMVQVFPPPNATPQQKLNSCLEIFSNNPCCKTCYPI